VGVPGGGAAALAPAWERRAAAPLVRLGILQVKSLRGASLGVGANAAAFTNVVYVGTLYLQTALGYSPLQAGLALLPLDVVSGLIGISVGGALLRRSPRAALPLPGAWTSRERRVEGCVGPARPGPLSRWRPAP
jgi:predicted small integral membrane protein